MIVLSLRVLAVDRLVGMSPYNELNHSYFIIALYANGQDIDTYGLYDPVVHRKIELKIVANSIRARRFSRIWINGISINDTQDRLRENVDNLTLLTSSLKGHFVRGDSISFEHTIENKVIFKVNGVILQTYQSPSFFN